MKASDKLNLLKGKMTPQQIRVTEFMSNMEKFIESAPKKDYVPKETCYYSYKILSCCPFASDSHLCKAFKVSAETLKQWVIDHEELSDSISRGKADGEALCRDMMLELSGEPSSSVNTQLIKILSQNVYNIREEHNLNLATPEALKWEVTVVDAKPREDADD